VGDGAEIVHLNTEMLWPPVREAEMYVQVRGAQQITVEIGLGPDHAFLVEGIHELIPEIRKMFAVLDPYVRRPNPKP
jgi:hypothetical protein